MKSSDLRAPGDGPTELMIHNTLENRRVSHHKFNLYFQSVIGYSQVCKYTRKYVERCGSIGPRPWSRLPLSLRLDVTFMGFYKFNIGQARPSVVVID